MILHIPAINPVESREVAKLRASSSRHRCILIALVCGGIVTSSSTRFELGSRRRVVRHGLGMFSTDEAIGFLHQVVVLAWHINQHCAVLCHWLDVSSPV